MTKLKPSWLIQRLNRPHSSAAVRKVTNPFRFGGGLRNGGLRDEAAAILAEIFEFDYMGNAEFEFGAVPRAISTIAEEADNFVKGEVPIPCKDIVLEKWEKKSFRLPKGKTVLVWYFCHRAHEEGVRKLITKLVVDREAERDLKASTSLRLALLEPTSDWAIRTCGWLELDNGFLFFTDRQMFKDICDLFGPEPVKEAKK